MVTKDHNGMIFNTQEKLTVEQKKLVDSCYFALMRFARDFCVQQGLPFSLQRDVLAGIYFPVAARCAKRFEPARGLKFITLLTTSCRHMMFSKAAVRWLERNYPKLAHPDSVPSHRSTPRGMIMDWWHNPTSPHDDPEVLHIFQETGRALKAAIDRLPLCMRRAIVGRYYEGKTYRQIGEENGVSRMTIFNQEKEAMEKLRVILKLKKAPAVRPGPDFV